MKRICLGLLLPLLLSGCLTLPAEPPQPPPRTSQESAAEGFLQMGEQYLQEGKLTEADNAFQAALRETPAGIWGARAKLGLAQVEQNRQNYTYALELSEQVLLEPELDGATRLRASLLAFEMQVLLQHNEAAQSRGLALLDAAPLSDEQRLDVLAKLLTVSRRQNDSQTAAMLVNQVFKTTSEPSAAWLDYFTFLAAQVYPEHAPVLKSLWPSREGQLTAELIWVKYYLKAGPLSEAQNIIQTLALTPDLPPTWQEALANTQNSISQALSGGIAGRVGLILPLSGEQAVYGVPLAAAVEMGLGILSGEEALTLYLEDDAGDPERAAMAVDRLVGEHQVLAIIGPLSAKSTFAAAQRAKELEVPMISLSQSSTDFSSDSAYVFQNYFSPEDQVSALLEALINQRGKRRVAILAPSNNLGKNFAQIMADTLTQKGGELVITRFYPAATVNFYPVVQELAAGYSFDAVFIPDQAERSGAILNAIAQAHMNKIVMGTNLWHTGKLLLTAGSAANGVIFPNAYDASVQQSRVAGDFVQEFKRTSGRLPNVLDAHGYDAGLILRRAITDSPLASRSNVALALRSIQRFPGLCGMLSVRENGKIMKPLTIFSVNNGRFISLIKSEDSF